MGVTPSAAFSDWLFSLGRVHSESSVSFRGFTAQFFFFLIFYYFLIPFGGEIIRFI